MINNRKILAIIPARGGSKGVPRKNIREVGGKPLVAWTIEEALKSKFIDRLILSSEDEEIIRVARKFGCDVPFIRPAELAHDKTTGIEPVLHALTILPDKYDYVVLLQPTSPLRLVEDIDSCIEMCVKQNANVCVSVTKSAKNPYWMYFLDSKGHLKPLENVRNTTLLRQDLPEVYMLNGAIYTANVDWFLKNKSFITEETIGYIMPPERSLDTDSEYDIKIASYLIEARRIGNAVL